MDRHVRANAKVRNLVNEQRRAKLIVVVFVQGLTHDLLYLFAYLLKIGIDL